MNISLILSIISLAFCLCFLFFAKWYIKHRTSVNELLAEYRTEVYRLNAEINAVTDRDSQLVEERIKKLNSILDETDKRINVYVRELERSKTGEALYTSLGRGIRAALKTPAETAPSAPTAPPAPKLSVVRTQERQLSLEPPVPELSLQPAQSEPTHTLQKTPSKKQIRSEIEKLIFRGVSPGEISSLLGISLSEVDLAVNLINHKKK